ncbi:MAG TPA: NAD(P)H-hydrate dehydratase [Casimicrobiaceae bacterium]|nr:NAD(P)H-hydrate dehydratase [Casimicrobiaceae bacterium]
MQAERDARLAPIYRTAELKTIEARHAADGLMERAGAASAAVAGGMLAERHGPVVVLAGPGNNGGDGFVVARLLRAAFHDVIVVFAADAASLPDDARRAHGAYAKAGGATQHDLPNVKPALIVDALFGIGLRAPLSANYAAWVHWANASDAAVLSLDVPTGLDADTGMTNGPVVHADATASFLGWKPGLLTGAGPDRCGDVSIHRLDVDAEAVVAPRGRRLDWTSLASTLSDTIRRRVRAVHKGTFGTVGIVGGADGMVGAALMAGRAALRCGAGKVRVGMLADRAPVVAPMVPELMFGNAQHLLEQPLDALVVGCGLGTSDAARRLVKRALDTQAACILDADALNLVARDEALQGIVATREAITIATPHPAEAARLARTTVEAIERDRVKAALDLARQLRAHAVLKGGGTVIAHPNGRFDINASGNPALAFAGSGDVLAGMLGALVAQRSDGETAARIGVCLHGAAADALVARGVGPIGVSSIELIDAARSLLNEAR